MKKGWIYLVAGLAVVTLTTVGFAGGKKGHVAGEVTKIEGAMITVKDDHGKEHMLHADDTTKKEGHIEVGAHVEAEATGSGHATSIMAHTEEHMDKMDKKAH